MSIIFTNELLCHQDASNTFLYKNYKSNCSTVCCSEQHKQTVAGREASLTQ